MKKFIYTISTVSVIILAVLLLEDPLICKEAIARGLGLCTQIIIPSLFPFTFCVLFLQRALAVKNNNLKNHNRFKFLRMPPSLFIIFLLSLIGGYPIGAKLLAESDATPETASTMINFCVNAGPAFIISAVGSGVFSSPQIGVILLISHIIPPFIIAFISRKKLNICQNQKQPTHLSFSDNFILSATQSASALKSICIYVLLFSVVCAYINKLGQSMPIIKQIGMFLEVTNGITLTKNIYMVSALLGFGGISVWFQVFALIKQKRPNLLKFSLWRIFHALSSAGITFMLVKIFRPQIPTLSNGIASYFSPFSTTAAVGISLIIMGILLLISLGDKKYTGKLLDDIV